MKSHVKDAPARFPCDEMRMIGEVVGDGYRRSFSSRGVRNNEMSIKFGINWVGYK